MDKQKKALSADEEADRILVLQRQTAEKSRLPDILVTVLILLAVFGFALAALIIPDRDFSETENRVLQKFPKITSVGGSFADRLLDGAFTSDMAKYFADQFPLRDEFTSLKAAVTIGALRRENDSVILGKNGYLVSRSGEVRAETLSDNFADLSAFADWCGDKGIGFSLAAAPRSADILGSLLSSPSPEEYTSLIRQQISAAEFEKIDLCDSLVSHVEGGEYIYYRTDHHWTTLGAYYAYREIGGLCGYEANPLGHYEVETASDSFYGTTWSSAGMRWVSPDRMDYYRYDGDGNYRVMIDGKEDRILSGFYDTEYLAKKDKYGSFLRGNNGRLSIYKVDSEGNKIEGRETLLIIKDSFAHSVIPFLAEHYDLEVIDLRYYRYSVCELAESSGAVSVLALYNYDSLITERAFKFLSLGR